MKSLNIMIVDDSVITIKRLAQILEELGHKVAYTAKTGKEAVEHYGSCAPDIVTMDITMPDMDGIAATKEILRHHPHALIIMVTSHRQERTVLDAIKAGAKAYIVKPFKEDKLKETIEKVFEKYGTAG